MNRIGNSTKTLINLDFMSILMILISFLLLSTIVLEGYFAPILLYVFMIIIGIILITLFSNKEETFFKIKMFIIFFSLSLVYTMINHYILINLFPNALPFLYVDDPTFYQFSNFGLPYITGNKNFFDMFDMFKAYKIHELPLHVVFSSLITNFSIFIDGSNTILIQKLLSPFFYGILSVILYSTLKYQFKNTIFALNATFAYVLLSAVFIYSTSLMRDIDIALAYMIFIYLFLQKNSINNLLFLFFVAFFTIYIRMESGMVLIALTLLYSHLYARKLQSKSIKFVLYILLMIMFSFVLLLMINKIVGMVMHLNEANTVRSVANASVGSVGLLLNKLPFPLSYIAKLFFGQLQPFPFFLAIDRPPEAISGIFWPFIFIIMIYAVMRKNIRAHIDIKVKYLLIVAIAILFLMSSEPMARRMMSVYPVIYITSLYTFFIMTRNEIKRIFFYYIFGIIVLNTFYYFIKL